MSDRQRVSTRAAVYYGDRFSDTCLAFRVSAADLDKNKIASTGTSTKLNRRYRGAPVESAMREKIVEYFTSNLTAEISERLAARRIDLENILLPATFRLTDQACTLYGHLPKPYRLSGLLKSDRLQDQSVHVLVRGGYGVRKHIFSVAEHIFEQWKEKLNASGIVDPSDLIDEMYDPNACHPSIYRVDHRRRESQLTLLPGGRT